MDPHSVFSLLMDFRHETREDVHIVSHRAASSVLYDDPAGKCKRRRSRTVFTAQSIRRMEDMFDTNRYPGIHERETLSSELAIPEPRIQVWFQNRRSRNKKTTCGNQPEQSVKVTETTRDSTRDLLVQSLLNKRGRRTEMTDTHSCLSDQDASTPDSHPSENEDIASPNYSYTDLVNNALHYDWLQYHMTFWQGWYPVLPNQYQQRHLENELAKKEEEDEYQGYQAYLPDRESSTSSDEECIVDRLFRFSKKRRPTKESQTKRKGDVRNSYKMKVPRINMTECSTPEFERSEHWRSDSAFSGYPSSGFDTCTPGTSCSSFGD